MTGCLATENAVHVRGDPIGCTTEAAPIGRQPHVVGNVSPEQRRQPLPKRHFGDGLAIDAGHRLLQDQHGLGSSASGGSERRLEVETGRPQPHALEL